MNTIFTNRSGRSRVASTRIITSISLAILLTIVGLSERIVAASGDVDLTFGTNGIVTTDLLDQYDFGRSVAIQPDGKIVVAGVANAQAELFDRVAIVRYLSNGDLDATFGNGSTVVGELAYIADMVLQADGKIVVVGKTAHGNTSDVIVRRYNSDGSADATFGIGGVVLTDMFSSFDGASAVALQTDGKIVVVGQTDPGQAFSDFAVLRYLSDGTLDATFGQTGKVNVDISGNYDSAHEVAIQADGKIIVVGRASDDFGIARLDAGGNLDQTFGLGGKVMTDFNDALDEANGVGLMSDGRIAVGGLARKVNNLDEDFGLACYTTSGQLDAGFGVGGKVTTAFNSPSQVINDLVIQPDNKIVAVGLMYDLSGGTTDLDYAIARYNPDGSSDGGFGNGGQVTTELGGSETAQGVALQPDCKIVVAGVVNPFNTPDSMFAVVRYDGGTCNASATCPRPQGYWKNNPALWPVDSLVLGTQTYSKAQLLVILNNSTKTDASIILAKQLIAAKLNIENGADASAITSSVSTADTLISGYSGKLPYKVKPSSGAGQAMVSLGNEMDAYNKGLLTPTCTP